MFRHIAPNQDMDENIRSEWDKRLHHAHPYDAVAVSKNDQQQISTVYGKPDPKPAPEMLYTFCIAPKAVRRKTK